MSEENSKDREYFMKRYNHIYKELNKLQTDMDEMEAAAGKLLKELQNLRNKETEQFKEKDGEI